MNDEQVVEAMAQGMCKRIFASEWGRFAGWYQRKKIALWSRDAAAALAALRAAGFDVYRPDECVEATVEHGGSYPDPFTGERRQSEPVLRSKQIETTRCILKLGTYRLVPVGGDS